MFRVKIKSIDWVLLIPAALLLAIGILIMRSASADLAQHAYGDNSFFLIRHLVSLAIAITVAIICFFVWQTRSVKEHAYWFLGIAVVLSVLTYFPVFGFTINGSHRWIRIFGVTFIPQPFVTLLYFIYVCSILSNEAPGGKFLSRTNIIVCLSAVILCIFFMFQPHTNAAALILVLLSACLIYFKRYTLSALIFFSALTLLITLPFLSEYRWVRLAVWFSPFSDRWDSGYQLVLSLLAVSGGDWFGSGMGHGLIHPKLPDAHKQFVFAPLQEEFGVAGGLVSLCLSFMICWRLLWISRSLSIYQKYFEGALVFIFSFWIGLKTVLNVLGTLAIFPFLNNVYPFLSCGPSHSVTFVLLISLALKFKAELNNEPNCNVQTRSLRYFFTICAFGLAFLTIAGCVAYKGVFDQRLKQEYLSFVEPIHKRNSLASKFGDTGAIRNEIVDRHGKVLAKNISSFDIVINPQKIELNQSDLAQLTALLNLDKNVFSQRFKRYKQSDKQFMYLLRNTDLDTAKSIYHLNLPGLSIKEVEKRFYPLGESFSHVLGLTDIDGKGTEGLEHSFDEQLTRSDNTQPLTSSIDYRAQVLLHDTLQKIAKDNSVKRGAAIAVDPRSGEILALTSYPSYDPNNRKALKIENLFNRAISHQLEPGMLIAPFTVMGNLNDATFRNSTTHIDTSPGYLNVEGKRVLDPINYGALTFSKVLQKKSKVGLAKIALSIPRKTLWDLLFDVGFGTDTGIELREEAKGYLPQWSDWSEQDTARLASGYGLSAPLTQLLKAYLPIANDGLICDLSLIRNNKTKNCHEALTTPAIARDIRNSLELEVAELPGGKDNVIKVAGISDSVRKVGIDGYGDRFTGLFIGMAPMDTPDYMIIVMLDESETLDRWQLERYSRKVFMDLVPSLEKLVHRGSETSE